MPNGLDRAILELQSIYSKLHGLQVFAENLESPEWLGYKGGVEDCRMHILVTIEKLEGERNGI